MADSARNSAGSTSTGFETTAGTLMLALEHLPDGCIVIDTDFRIHGLNATIRKDVGARGLDPSHLIGRSLWDLLPYPTDMPARVAVERAVEAGMPTHFSMQGVYSDHWIEAHIAPMDGGAVLYYRDVTWHQASEHARVVSETELRVTNDRLQRFIDAAPIAIIILDVESRVVGWNRASEQMFQWTEAEVLGKALPTVGEVERPAFEALIAEEKAGMYHSAVAARRRRKDGVVLDVQISTAPLRNAAQEVVGLVGMITDMTRQRKLEAQLRMAQKMEAVGLLAGGVAHDFNNLLTAIKGFASLLEMTVRGDGQSNEFLGEINKAADRAAALTGQLLAFSRRQLLRPEPLDLNVRVRDLERMLRLLLRQDAELVLQLDPSLANVLVDPGQIEQVILNLVVNARDAVRGRPAGCVVIATSNVELRQEFAAWGVEDAPGFYVRLDVRDNGVGIDPATQARIFDPFFTTKEPGQGTGLGLATLFGIVKQSGGYVWVDSAPGAGATFSVYLPRAQSAARTSGANVAVQESTGRQILLVEDEAAVRRVARRALEMAGFTIVEAADGKLAVELARTHDFDLVLTDVMMPGMMGTEVAKEILATRPELPVLFMSGHADELARVGLIDPDTPFLAKPFSPAQLVAKVTGLLDGG